MAAACFSESCLRFSFSNVVLALQRCHLLFDHRRRFDALLIARDVGAQLRFAALQRLDAELREISLGDDLLIRRIGAQRLLPRALGLRPHRRGIGARRLQFFFEGLDLRMLVGVLRPREIQLTLNGHDTLLRGRRRASRRRCGAE